MIDMSKIQVGYGTGGRKSLKKGTYGTCGGEKIKLNGGFNGMPTVDFTDISDDRWAQIFGTSSLPKWKRELLEAGESLD
jgi:hypothetical protein